jgi:multiple sugar transport system substrate-binding protein
VAYADVYDFQVDRQVGLRRQAGRHQQRDQPHARAFRAQHGGDDLPLQRRTKTRAYYAFPIKQQTMHIEYWVDMLNEAGFKESDIPTDWKGYWSFWCDKVQPAHRQKTGNRTFGIGQPLGVDSSDSFYSFLTFMDAYNVKLVSDSGKLLVDDPKVRAGLIGALTDYTQPYAKGCTPPSSTSWKDPDNNVAFHNKTTILTHNATISIAAKWLDDMNNASLKPEEREPRRRTTPSASARPASRTSPTAARWSTARPSRPGVVFNQAKNKARAKEFVSFLMQEENLTPYVEGSLGRWFPVTKAGSTSVLESRCAPPVGLQPVHRRNRQLRVHQELQVHHPEQRERLGQGGQPRDQ